MAAEPSVVAAPAPAPPPEARVLLLVRTPRDEAVIELLLAELEPHDWRVVELRPDARDVPAPLADIAAQQSATAVVRFSHARGTLELWVAGASGPSEETIASVGETTSNQILALRATEALRARGLDFGSEKRATEPSPAALNPPKHERPPARPAQPSDSAPPRALLLELGPAVTASPGGMGALFLFGASARAELTRELGMSANAWLPLTSPSVRGAEGSANWTSSLFGGSLDVTLANMGPFGVRAAGGVLVSVTHMTGEPASGFDGRTESVVATVPFLRTTLRAALGEDFGVWVAGGAGLSFPELRMRFDEREAARSGRPLLLAGVGLDVRLLRLEKSSQD